MSNDPLVTPYGGTLVNLVVEDEERSELTNKANTLSSFNYPAGLCTCLLAGWISPRVAMGKRL